MKKLVLILCILCSNAQCYAIQQSFQVLSAALPEVLEIEKIIVEDIKYNSNDPMPNMKIKETTPVDVNNTTLRLSPVKVQLHTNTASPVVVSVWFKELNHKDGKYNFSQNNLSVAPNSQTVSNCSNHFITEVFTPYINVKPDSALGLYRGTLVFTVNSI